jgi:CDGSH-type Zn-finger protein
MTDAIIAQKAPFPVTVEAGRKYVWCACGRSASQPFCDGSHKSTGIVPVVFRADETDTLWFCGCKQTRQPPFCDGSHSAL